MITFQSLIFKLQTFWAEQGCVIVFPFDTEKGAGTMSPHTFLRALGPHPWNVAYVEPSRRPTDGRYAENPNRLQHYFQFQVILKPSPSNVQDLYIKSLEAIGLNRHDHDIRFVEDNWESPTLGAWGVGWEVWLNGMEITQFTYFQQCGGFDCNPVSVEITYGLERLCMYLQKSDHVMKLLWQDTTPPVTYSDIYKTFEIQHCKHNFDAANSDRLFALFDTSAAEAHHLLDQELPIPAYEYCLKCSHTFNLLDARSAISVSERMNYILKIRKIAHICAKKHILLQEKLSEKDSQCLPY